MSVRKNLQSAQSVAELNSVYLAAVEHQFASDKTRRRWERTFKAQFAVLSAAESVQVAREAGDNRHEVAPVKVAKARRKVAAKRSKAGADAEAASEVTELVGAGAPVPSSVEEGQSGQSVEGHPED